MVVLGLWGGRVVGGKGSGGAYLGLGWGTGETVSWLGATALDGLTGGGGLGCWWGAGGDNGVGGGLGEGCEVVDAEPFGAGVRELLC